MNRPGFSNEYDYRAGIDEIPTVEHLLESGCGNQVPAGHGGRRANDETGG